MLLMPHTPTRQLNPPRDESFPAEYLRNETHETGENSVQHFPSEGGLRRALCSSHQKIYWQYEKKLKMQPNVPIMAKPKALA